MAFPGDRSGSSGLRMLPPVIVGLIVLNVLLFLIGMVPIGAADVGGTMDELLLQHGALWPIGSQYFMPWQYVTYMFLHGGFMHIFFNMLVLWMFGNELAEMWGGKRFLVYYLLCGLGAGIVHSLVTLFLGSGAPTVGASGAIMGVMIAFGMIFPDRIIYFNLFLPMKAKYAVILFAGIDLYMGIANGISSSAGDNVAHFAHLGGALVGFILIQIGGKMTLGGIFDRLPKGIGGEAPQSSPAPARVPSRARIVDVPFRDVQAAPQRQATTMNFGADQERIDAILDKISHTGYQNLTEEEKAMLLDASRKMR